MWDSIQYIFQIPLAWFKKIHARVFNAYGAGFISLKEGYYGGTEVGIDSDAFGKAIDSAGFGKIKTVNSIGPNDSGNVNVGTVKSVNNNFPDASGNVTVQTGGGGTVNSVDGVSPDSATGNVQLNAIRTINGIAGTNGNFNGVVTSVNGETPTNGEVTLDVVYTVNDAAPDVNGNVDVGTVRSVDGHSPDSDGAVSFGLTANKWLKSDAAGHIVTTNDNVISVPSGTTPSTGTVDVVTNVTWNGTQIVVANKRLNFTNGIYTGATSLTNTTINTVAYTS